MEIGSFFWDIFRAYDKALSMTGNFEISSEGSKLSSDGSESEPSESDC